MKPITSLLIRLPLLAAIVPTATAATLILDDFTQGAFALQFDRPNDKSNWLDLSYSRRSGGFSILGYEAFSLSLANLVGLGEVMAYSGGTANGIAMPITGTGEMMIPYSKLNTTIPLGDFSSLHFRFIGLSSDFSVTVDRIALVPEPGSLGLLAASTLLLLTKRRRWRSVG